MKKTLIIILGMLMFTMCSQNDEDVSPKFNVGLSSVVSNHEWGVKDDYGNMITKVRIDIKYEIDGCCTKIQMKEYDVHYEDGIIGACGSSGGKSIKSIASGIPITLEKNQILKVWTEVYYEYNNVKGWTHEKNLNKITAIQNTLSVSGQGVPDIQKTYTLTVRNTDSNQFAKIIWYVGDFNIIQAK